MVKEAEEHAEEDKKLREYADTKNEAESFIGSTEKTLKELGDKVTSDEKTKIEDNIKNLKESLDKNDDINTIKSKLEELKQSSYSIAQKLYETSNAQPNQEAQTNSNASGKADDVEYEVKDA
jgi:molecular chaperone DnaK